MSDIVLGTSYLKTSCKSSSCSHASGHDPCRCVCGGSGHGLLRLVWATAWAQHLGVPPSAKVMEHVSEWQKARDAAEEKIKGLTQKQQKSRRRESSKTVKKTPKKGLKNEQVYGSAEYVCTVSLVIWLAQNNTRREQIEGLATEMSKLGAQALDCLIRCSVKQEESKNRLGDHFWCDCLAAVIVSLREIKDLPDKLKTSVSNLCAELALISWREVKASRETSHGYGPATQRKDLSRSEHDRKAGIDEYILKRIVKAVVSKAVGALMLWGPDLEHALLNLRVLTLLLCPDPSAHKLVWENCWRPLFQMVLEEKLADKLEQLNQLVDNRLDQEHTWDTA